MMTANSFSQADNIYICSQDFSLDYQIIEYPELFALTSGLRMFFMKIGEISADRFWAERRRKLKRLAFLFSSAPLSKNYLSEKLDSTITFIDDDIIQCETFYPSLLNDYIALLEALKNISGTDLDAIKMKVDKLVDASSGSIAILIKDTKLIPIVEKIYSSNPNVSVVSINLLRRNPTYNNMIIVGPVSKWWFPDFIFSSPRAKSISLVKFKWMRGIWEPKPVFPNSIISPKREKLLQSIEEPDESDQFVEPDVLLPSVDFSSIIFSSWEEAEGDSETELVEAIIARLENDQIVFLDFNESSTIRIIEIEDEEKPVKKIRVKELTQEMFLLLKTSGGGDYIVPIADNILGDQAIDLRSSQKQWKDRLRKIQSEKGTDWLVNELVSRGCTIANQTNVRNWISYRSIKTSQFSHFNAIVEVIGLQGQAQTIWHQMRLITQAHIKAGRYITNLLLKIAREADLSELMRLGTMEFELPEKDAGSLTAYRITALSDRNKTVLVSPSKIGVPLDIE